MEKTDLSLVSVESLLEEINKRYEHWIFVGMQEDDRINKVVTMRRWRGNAATCAGLASQIQIVIFDKHMEGETKGYPP